MIWYLNGGFLLVFFVKRALSKPKVIPHTPFLQPFLSYHRGCIKVGQPMNSISSDIGTVNGIGVSIYLSKGVSVLMSAIGQW